MTDYTPNLNLDLYEGDDKPNLRDQYNSSMYKIDEDLSTPFTSSRLADGAVITSKIYDGAVTTDKIADDAVTNGKIADDAVDTAQIKDDAITNDKIRDYAIGDTKIYHGAVTTDKIADNAVTPEKLADQATIYPFSGKKIVIYGDSTMVDHSGGSTPLGDLIAEATDADVTNRAVGGTTLSGTSANSFYSLLDAAGTGTFTGFDFMLIAYGTNDWQGSVFVNGYNAGSFEYYLNQCYSLIKSKAPNLVPVFITPAGGYRQFTVGTHTNTQYNAVGARLEDYVNAILDFCFKNRIPCIDLFHLCAIPDSNITTYFFESSGLGIYVHYKEAFKETIAKMIANCYPYGVASTPYTATQGYIRTNTAVLPTEGASNAEINTIVNAAPEQFPSLPIFKVGAGSHAYIQGVFTGQNTLVFAQKAGSRIITVSVANTEVCTVQGSGVFAININGITSKQARIDFYNNDGSNTAWVCNPMLLNGIGSAYQINPSEITLGINSNWLQTNFELEPTYAESVIIISETGTDLHIYGKATGAISMGDALMLLPGGIVGQQGMVITCAKYASGAYSAFPILLNYNGNNGVGALKAGEAVANGSYIYINAHIPNVKNRVNSVYSS